MNLKNIIYISKNKIFSRINTISIAKNSNFQKYFELITEKNVRYKLWKLYKLQ